MLSTTTVKELSHQLVSIYSYPTIGTIGARKTVNDKESAWRKIEKAAIRCIDTRWSITELMHTPSVYTAVRRIFSFLSDLSFYYIYSSAAQSAVYCRITTR